MDEKQAKRKLRRWTLGCALVAIALQAGFSALVFIPQNRLLEVLREQDAEIERIALNHARSAEKLREAGLGIETAAAELAALNLPGVQPPPHAILEAVGQAVRVGGVRMAGMNRTAASSPQLPPEQVPFWTIKLQGAFPEVIRFLTRIERQGILLGSQGFKMWTDPREEGIIVEVAVSSHTEQTLANLHQAASQDK